MGTCGQGRLGLRGGGAPLEGILALAPGSLQKAVRAAVKTRGRHPQQDDTFWTDNETSMNYRCSGGVTCEAAAGLMAWLPDSRAAARSPSGL